MRGASVSFTGVAVLLSSHTEPGLMEPEVFPSEPLVGAELGFTLASSHYWHLDLLQSVAEEALAIYISIIYKNL